MPRKLLDSVSKPEVQSHAADVQLLLVSKDQDPPEQQDWSSSLDQKDPPELPHIKEEQEELRTSQEGGQLQGPEEADVIKFTFDPVAVKSEEDEPQSSEPQRTEADGEDCGGPGPAWDSDPDNDSQPDTDEKTSDGSESDDSCDWVETNEPESGLNSRQNNKASVSDVDCEAGETPVSCSESAASSDQKDGQQHEGVQTQPRPFQCSVCGKRYPRKKSLTTHMIIHSEDKGFNCSFCNKKFQRRSHVLIHMRVHTGEKPFCCYFCGKGFAQSSALTSHERVHTGEKPFTCSVCAASFNVRSTLTQHMRMHTGEKPFPCSYCGKTFAHKGTLTRHLNVHTAERSFSCSVCGQKFAQKGTLRRHLTVHTGEKRFGCSVCDRRFSQLSFLKKHKCVGEKSRSKGSGRDVR